MKKVAFFVLIFFTYNLAGMYRSLPLMALCVMELMLMTLLFIQPRYVKKKMSMSFLKANKSTEEGNGALCSIRVQNLSRLPVNQFRVSLHIRYPQDIWSVRKKLRGSAEQGENNVEFQISAKYCGLIQIRMRRLRVYDYLGLFSSGKSLAAEMRVAVFPKEQAFDVTDVRLSASGLEQGSQPGMWTVDHKGDAHDEIRQIREYRDGDLKRYIYWNQSAKTENLWIKEYEREADVLVSILIDSTGFSRASARKLSAFYKALFSLMLGLLRNMTTVRVYWYQSDKGCLIHMDGSDADQCRDILLQLYQTDFSKTGKFLMKEISGQSGILYQEALRLTLELFLFQGEALICRFPQKMPDRRKEVGRWVGSK